MLSFLRRHNSFIWGVAVGLSIGTFFCYAILFELGVL